MPQLRDDEEELKRRAAALFNEVINSDLTALAERIDAGAPINFMGTCGEAPLHIAIYKRDDSMIQMLLEMMQMTKRGLLLK